MKLNKYLTILFITILFSPVALIQSHNELSGGIVYLENLTNRKDQQAFQQLIEKGNIVVDFYATWCRPCNQLSTIMSQIAREFPQVTFIKVNIENFQMLRDHYGIRSMPTLLYFKDGKLISRSVGLMSKKIFADKLKTLYS